MKYSNFKSAKAKVSINELKLPSKPSFSIQIDFKQPHAKGSLRYTMSSLINAALSDILTEYAKQARSDSNEAS